MDEEDIAEVVSQWTGIPVSRLMEGEVEKLLQMEERLHERVVGQDEAIARRRQRRPARAGRACRTRTGRSASFIFLGPTGVGKTELARALAEFLFDDEQAMVRIDMSRVQGEAHRRRLIGAPPGYVGYEEGGQLTEAVRRRPYSVVLFDEIEKAHPEVFNVLLQLLDDGRLTDGQGRTVDFKNTVVIMTSNLGSQYLTRSSTADDYGRGPRPGAWRRCASHFRPEFLNRVDEVIIFHPLGIEQITQIVDIQLPRLQKRLAERRDRGRADRRRARVPGEGGLRPGLRRAAAEADDPAAGPGPAGDRVLEGEFREGDTILVDVEGDDVVFRKGAPAEVALT